MQKQQFIDIIKKPQQLEFSHLAELEMLVKEYPFFESAHLLYTKGLHKYQAINYSKQLRKTAIVVNSRSVLYELLHRAEPSLVNEAEKVELPEVDLAENKQIIPIEIENKREIGSVSSTNNEIKAIYINTVPNTNNASEKSPVLTEQSNDELNIIKSIENETEVSENEFDIDKLNKNIEQEISKGIIQSYIETDVLKTPELNKVEVSEPSSFTDWLKILQKENHTFQTNVTTAPSEAIKSKENAPIKVEIDKKTSLSTQNKQIIDKIIESDPGRIKLGTNKFFTPALDAKQSLLENEHLVTETLAKIYALQGNISKAIRAYEILSLKFPQKSVYFASLIQKLKTNK
ncbi:MAG: hypothetical protein K9H41_11490 [Bacteroidia bacterium]|nr:hypothetical protein [Bacteroidia bacterium]